MTDAVLMVGLMSGTSLDGMDAALVRCQDGEPPILLAFTHRPYQATERALLEEVLQGTSARRAARLHAQMGTWACEAVAQLLQVADCPAGRLAGIVFPGQTIWHEPPLVTWQLGDAARVAETFGVPVVHDLRARDVAAGGEGAPLVPLVDALCFAGEESRALLNIGGMANATWVPPRHAADPVLAGDSGPGMAVIDMLARRCEPTWSCDRDGALARQGRVHAVILAELLEDPFFRLPVPRSTGRERFGAEYAAALAERLPGPDGVRTAVALTAASIDHFLHQILPPVAEVLVSGGGVHHPVLMEEIAARCSARGMRCHRFDTMYFDGDAKEAVAFAVIGWRTLRGEPGNLPSVTGARGPRVLGSVVPP